MAIKVENKICEYCSDKFVGRADKRFCSDDCRTSYHNAMNRDSSKFMANINKILRKNRRILATLNPDGKSKVTKANLLDEGFNFAYHTNEFKTKAGRSYYFCYDQGYIQLDDGAYALVIKHEYVDR